MKETSSSRLAGTFLIGSRRGCNFSQVRGSKGISSSNLTLSTPSRVQIFLQLGYARRPLTFQRLRADRVLVPQRLKNRQQCPLLGVQDSGLAAPPPGRDASPAPVLWPQYGAIAPTGPSRASSRAASDFQGGPVGGGLLPRRAATSGTSFRRSNGRGPGGPEGRGRGGSCRTAFVPASGLATSLAPLQRLLDPLDFPLGPVECGQGGLQALDLVLDAEVQCWPGGPGGRPSELAAHLGRRHGTARRPPRRSSSGSYSASAWAASTASAKGGLGLAQTPTARASSASASSLEEAAHEVRDPGSGSDSSPSTRWS